MGTNLYSRYLRHLYALGVVCYITVDIVGILLTHKSNALSEFSDILAAIAFFGHDKPRRIRIDNDSVFLSTAFTNI